MANNGCKGGCGCGAAQAIKEMQDLLESQRRQSEADLANGYNESYKILKEHEDREISLEDELERTKAELAKTKEALAIAQAQQQGSFMRNPGFKACADVVFTPNPEKSE